jgi:hypothetical protein
VEGALLAPGNYIRALARRMAASMGDERSEAIQMPRHGLLASPPRSDDEERTNQAYMS